LKICFRFFDTLPEPEILLSIILVVGYRNIEIQCGNFNWNKIHNLDIGDFCKKIPKQVHFCFSFRTFSRIWFLHICSRKCATRPNFFFQICIRVCQVTPRLKGYFARNTTHYCRLALSFLSLCDRFRCNEIINLTMRDIKDLGSAIVVKVQDTKNYKLRSFTILGKFYVEICRKYIG
jgi:hypothetical protein